MQKIVDYSEKTLVTVEMVNIKNQNLSIECVVKANTRDTKSAESQARVLMTSELGMDLQETLQWRMESLVWHDMRSNLDWCPSCNRFLSLEVEGEKYYDGKNDANRICGNCGHTWLNKYAEQYKLSKIQAPCCGKIVNKKFVTFVELFNKPIYVKHEYECWNCNRKYKHQGILKSTPLILID